VEAIALAAGVRAHRPTGGRGGQPRSPYPISSDVHQACAVLARTHNTTELLLKPSSARPQLHSPSRDDSDRSDTEHSHFAHADQRPEAQAPQLDINGSLEHEATADQGVEDATSSSVSEQLRASNVTKRQAKGSKRSPGDADDVFPTVSSYEASFFEQY
jgi:hypothetical protein